MTPACHTCAVAGTRGVPGVAPPVWPGAGVARRRPTRALVPCWQVAVSPAGRSLLSADCLGQLTPGEPGWRAGPESRPSRPNLRAGRPCTLPRPNQIPGRRVARRATERPAAPAAHHRSRRRGRRPDRQPALRPAAAAVGRGPAQRYQPLHQLPGRLGRARAWPSTTRCGSSPTTSARWLWAWPRAWASSCCAPGTPGKRFSLPHAQVLMHQGSAGFGGTAADIEIYAGQLERTGTHDDQADRPAHRAAGGAGRAGQPAGPLVQRGGGPRLRDHRPHRGAASTTCRPAAAGEPAGPAR